LQRESKNEGYNLINKLADDYESGENKFAKKGECLIACKIDKKIVGICGLNIDPTNSKRGRLRRLYVSPRYRGKGIGGELVKAIINYSRKYFESVSVNIGKLDVSTFYEELGFEKYSREEGITHLLAKNKL